MAPTPPTPSNFEEVLPPPPPDMISKRALQTISQTSFSSQLAHFARNDEYDRNDNPKGVISLATAINQLMKEDVLSQLNKGDTLKLTSRYQYYSESYGIAELRQAVASFFTRHHKPRKAISPDNLIVLSGLTSCLETLSHILCDEGDVVITPTPVYARIFTNFQNRSNTTVVPLQLLQKDNFTIKEENLESLIQKHLGEGQRVRVCVLLNPHNPLGHIYSTEQLLKIMAICARYKIHVVIDEIYAFSIYGKDTHFNSVLGMDAVPDPQRTHVLWGFSKDFAIPGFRLGLIHSLNPWVLSSLKTLSHYHTTPSLTQHAAASLLNDVEWCDKFYIPTNKKKLAAAYKKASERLEAIGVKVHKSVAGVYLWVNMQDFLDHSKEDSDMELFSAFIKGGVSLLPGRKLYDSHPGWYRIVFAIDDHTLEEALRRIQAVLSEWKQKRKSK